MNIMNIITTACLALIILGFLLGFFRSFKKSLSRFILIAICLFIAIFVTPILSEFLIKNFVKGYVFNGFGFNVDFKELFETNFGSSGDTFSDILAISTTENLVTSFMNIAINLVAFIALFIVLLIITLILFWIGSLIVMLTDRKKSDYEIKKANRKKISYRLAGGLFGLISSMVLCFVISVPVFGVMNICDKFLEDSTTEAAGALGADNFVSGQLFYKEDEKIGQIEGYVEQYANIKNIIESSAIGKVAGVFGLTKLGETTFDYLTTVKQNGLQVSLTNEIVSVIKVYNIYKEGFIENQFDANNQESIDKALDSIELIYSEANNSSIIKSYLVELIPKFRERWIAGESYLGIEFPVQGEYRDLTLAIMDKGFNTYNLGEINNNVYSLINILRIANDSGIIQAIQNEEDIVEKIKNDETNLIKNVIVELSKSKFGDALPIVIEDVVKLAYDIIIDTNDILTKEEINNIFADVNSDLPDNIDWENEGACLQNLIKNSLGISDIFYNSESSSDVIIENLDKLGIVIDNARTSVFSNHFKILVNKMVNTKIDSDILGSDAMDILTVKLDANWSNQEFKFSDMFNVLKQTAILAQKLTVDINNSESATLDDIVTNLESVVGEIILNEQVKDTFVRVLETNVIDKFIPEEHADTIIVVKDMVNSFMENTTEETLKADILAGKEIINIVNTSVNSGTFTLEDESLTKEEKAEEIVETIVNSNAIMTIVEKSIEDELVAGELQQMAQNMSGEDVDILKGAIESMNTESENAEEQATNEAKKLALKKLFGIE